jgi:hypothetical protein
MKEMPFDLEVEKQYYIKYWKDKGIGFDGVELPPEKKSVEKREYTFDTTKLVQKLTKKPLKLPIIDDNNKDS